MSRKDMKLERKSSGIRIEDMLDKDPKIYTEHLFETYDQDSINNIMKGLQKKIMEKENSLKQMLSLKYVDLLNCSELIQSLKVFSKEIAHNASFTQEYLQKSDGVLLKCREATQAITTARTAGSARLSSARLHEKAVLTAADEHLFYIAGQKILISPVKEQNSLETLFIITTFLNIFRAYELECSVKKSKKMSELIHLLEDALFANFDKSFDFSRGTNNYDNILPVLSLMKLRTYIINYNKRSDFESTKICQFLKNELDCDVSGLLLQDSSHSDELIITLKTFLHIIEAVIKQGGGDSPFTLQFFVHQLAEIVRIFLMEKDPYGTVSSYLEFFKNRVADLFQVERLVQIEKLLDEAVDLESDLVFDDVSTPIELIKEFYTNAIQLIQPLMVALIAGKDGAQFNYPGIRALLFDAPSLRDFVILEEYLWQEELKESNLGDLLKELWKKHVDQAHNETIATIRIDERVEKLVQDVHPQLGDFDNRISRVRDTVSGAAKDFSETLKKVFVKLCEVIDTGAEQEIEHDFFQISNARAKFQSRFENSLQAVSAVLNRFTPSQDQPDSIEQKTISVYLMLSFVDLALSNAKKLVDEDSKFEGQRQYILDILQEGRSVVLSSCQDNIKACLQVFIDYVKALDTTNQGSSVSDELALTLLHHSNIKLKKISQFIKRINETTIILGLFNNSREERFPLTASYQHTFKSLAESNLNEQGTEPILTLLSTFEMSSESKNTRNLNFLQFYESTPNFTILPSTHTVDEKQLNKHPFNASFAIGDPFLYTTLFPKAPSQPQTTTQKSKHAETTKAPLFSIGNEGRQLAQQTEEKLAKARTMVTGMVSNWMTRMSST